MSLNTVIESFVQQQRLGQEFVAIAQNWFVDVAERILMHVNGANASPLFVGINGCQGAGKTTLCAFISEYLASEHQISTVVMSLDDFYLTKQQRQQRAKVHPLFETRGVPGTHDTELLASVLTALSEGKTVKLPSFDKSQDDRTAESSWKTTNDNPSLVLIEGWCWGTLPQTPTQLKFAINDLEQQRDPQGVWRQRVNQYLTDCYLPLYSFIDKWLMINAPSFGSVYKWRLQQERQLQQRHPSASRVMSEQQIEQFIQYFQRLTLHSLETMPDQCDWLLRLDECRNITHFEFKDS